MNDPRANGHLDPPVKVIGWGPFRLPGERRRLRRAEKEARRLLGLPEEVERA